jgi:putative hemolysin
MRLVVVALLAAVVTAVLTASAIAVRSVSRIWLRHWVDRRLRGAPIAELYLDRPQRLLVSAGTGVALAVFLAGAAIGADSPSTTQVAWQVAVVGLVVLGFGQLLPRALARRWPTPLVPVLVPVLRVVDAIVLPLRWAGALLARPFRTPEVREPGDAARSDIEELLREGAREGVGASAEIAIITGVVQFGEKTAGDVMTPRDDIFAVDTADPPDVAARRIATSQYSRVPAYRGTVDDIIGMVHAFDVLKSGGDEWPPIRAVATATPDTPCNQLLFSMLRTRRHLAVVHDPALLPGQPGATVGVVSLEDLLEELVGDIRDEHDEPESSPPTP